MVINIDYPPLITKKIPQQETTKILPAAPSDLLATNLATAAVFLSPPSTWVRDQKLITGIFTGFLEI